MRWITRQETKLEKHHQNTLRCSGGAESILQSLRFKGYEDTTQKGRTETECDSVSVTVGAGCLTAGMEELGVGVEERKTWNKRTKEMPRHLVEQDSEQTPWEHRCLIPWKQNSGSAPFPPPKKHLFISSVVPLREEGQAGGQGEAENPNGKPCTRFFESWALPVNWSYFHE